MSTATCRPKSLWSQKSLTPSVSNYFAAYLGEFDTDWIESDYPHQGPPSDAFRRLTRINSHDGYDRFKGKGIGCWGLRRDRTLNPLTADLLAAADALGGKLESESSSALPGGIGADSANVWVALLDGGVGVEVVLSEHETTNRVLARQCTSIRGPRAYRSLLECLGFKWTNRKLPDEQVCSSHGEIVKLVNDFLVERGLFRRSAGTRPSPR